MAHTWTPFMLIRSYPIEGLRVDYPPLFATVPPEQVIEAVELVAAHLLQEAAARDGPGRQAAETGALIPWPARARRLWPQVLCEEAEDGPDV